MITDYTIKLNEQNLGFEYSDLQLPYYSFEFYVLEVIN